MRLPSRCIPVLESELQNTGVFAMNGARIVLTSIGVYERADKLAHELVERGLAACVNIVGPIRSVYRWKGKVENEQEYLLIIKTTAARAQELGAVFAELHSYELPERVEIEIAGGSADYLEWLGQLGTESQ